MVRENALKVVTLRTGEKYGPEYAEILEASLRRNTGREFAFEVIRESPWPGWWGKLGIYPPSERTVCLDLDVVITGNVDFLFDYDGPFCGWEDPMRGKYNGSVFSIAAGFGQRIKDGFTADPQHIMNCFYSDQEYISSVVGLGDTWQKIAPGKVKSYKCDRLENGPGEASIVVFHGDPKPHVFTDGWVKEYWHGDRTTK